MAIRLIIRHRHAFVRGGAPAIRIVGQEARSQLGRIATRIALGTLAFYREDAGVYKEALRVAPVTGVGTQIRTRVYTNARHAATLEDGRGANKTPPPVDNILAWMIRRGIEPRPRTAVARTKARKAVPGQKKSARGKKKATRNQREQKAYLRKIGISDRREKQLRSAAYAIAKAIGRDGLAARAPMKKSTQAQVGNIRASVGQASRIMARNLNAYAGS